MKQLIYGMVCLALVGITGCKKNQSPKSTDDKVETQNVKPNNLSQQESQIQEFYEMFSVIKQSQPTAVMTLSKSDGKIVMKVEKLKKSEYEKLQNKANRGSLCKGEGLTFARCVQKKLDKLGCIVVTTCLYCADPCPK